MTQQRTQKKEHTWDDLVAAIGQDFSGGIVRTAADAIDRSAIRRYLEPLENDCPLHYDDEVARKHGYQGIVLPWAAYTALSGSAFWKPGDPDIWDTTDPDHTVNGVGARTRQSEGPQPPSVPMPETNGAFATDIEIEYLRPVYLGDRLSHRGRKLVSVMLRETRVGYGAFSVFESEIFNQRGEVVARLRNGGYAYVVGAKGPSRGR